MVVVESSPFFPGNALSLKKEDMKNIFIPGVGITTSKESASCNQIVNNMREC